MKKHISSSLLLVLTTFFALQSCTVKEGCTDPFAVNYYESITIDDGSCKYSSSRMIGDFKYDWKDTLERDAFVSPDGISSMKIFPKTEGAFDQNITEFYMIIDWENKSMFMPDSLCPPDAVIDGQIEDIDNFTISMNYDPDSTHMDSIYSYTFTRL